MRLLWFNLQVDKNRQGLAFGIDWINAMAARVDRIDVITMSAGEYDVRDNVRVYSVGKEKGYSEPRRAFEFYRILWKLLGQHQYDGCFAHMMPLFAVMAAPVLRLKQIPIVLWYAHKSVTPMLRLAERLVNRIVTSSREGFRLLSPKVRIIGQGIDIEKFVPLEKKSCTEQPFILLTVSRLSKIKRIDLLIQALARLTQKQPDAPVRLKIVGGPLTDEDQQYASELRQQVEHYHLQDSVEFVGSVSFQDIMTYYQQADGFVNLSDTGSIDKTVLEAMSCGLIVLTVPTYHDVLGDEFAKLFEVEPEPESVSERLEVVLALSPEKRREIGAQLRERVVNHHSLETLCTRILNEFGNLS